MNVLSLFHGYGGSNIAFQKLGVEAAHYVSEIDKHAIAEDLANNPNNTHLGDVTGWRSWDIDWASIDILIAGSPCQGFSDSGKGLNFSDPRSKLFFEFIDIRDHILSLNSNLKWLLENVQMKRAWEDKISELTGEDKMMINASLVSPCYRPRNYWFNWHCDQPRDLNLNICDFVGDEFIYPASITGRRINPGTGRRDDYNKDIPIAQWLEVQPHQKARCVTTVSKDCLLSSLPPGKYKDAYSTLEKGVHWREPSISELCVFHGVPDDYFKVSSDRQASKMIGNGWNIDVICHILKSLNL